MGRNLAFHILVYFLSISIQNQDAEAASTNQTYHHCNCPAQTPACGYVNISCASDISVEWIGLRDFAFGLLPNGSNCSTEATSSFVIPTTRNNHINCVQDFNTMLDILDRVSGNVISNRPFSMDVYCNLETAYFIANYDCVTHTSSTNDLTMDYSCNYNKTLNALPISSISYPQEVIKSTGVRSCQCLLKTTAKELVLRTYDNRLATNQTLTLSYGNHSVIKEWRNTTVIEDVLNTVHITEQFSNTQLLLNWENSAEMDRGKIWVVLEAIGGNITAICKQNISTTLSPTATPPPNTAAVNGSSLTLPSTGNMQDSSSVPLNAFNDSSLASQNSTTVTVSTPMTLNSAASTKQSTTLTKLDVSSPSLPNSTVLSPTYSGNTTSSLSSRVEVTSFPSSRMNTENTDATTHESAQSEEPSGGKGNIAAIIGGVVGGLAALILLILCCCLLCLKKNRKTEPETNEQPANSKYKNDNNQQGKPDGNEQDSKHNVDSSELAVAASISGYTFPPLPTGRLVNNVQNKTGPDDLDGSRNGHIPFGANSKQEKSNIRENGKLNDALYARLTGDVLDENKFTSDDMVPLTEPTLGSVGNTRGASMIESQENDGTDDNGQEKKKKKKKRKKKRKWNQIGTLLDEDVNAEPKLQDNEQFPPYDF